MRRASSGFTLLEVMVAVSILAVSLTWIVSATSRAIASENHAKLMTTASFLARGRLVELEDELQEKGFTDQSFATETAGDFKEQGFQRFSWTTVIDKIELPGTAEVESLMSKANQSGATLGGLGGKGDSPIDKGGLGATPVGAGGAQAGLLGTQFGVIKQVMEESIRRARVRVVWSEGKKEHAVEVVEYLTDPRRVDNATGGAAGLLNALGGGGAAGAGGGAAGAGGNPVGGNPLFGGGGTGSGGGAGGGGGVPGIPGNFFGAPAGGRAGGGTLR